MNTSKCNHEKHGYWHSRVGALSCLISVVLGGMLLAGAAPAEDITAAAPVSDPNALAPGCTFREGAVVRGPVRARRLALVFTGHEYAESGGTILAVLERRGVQASFFLTGDFLANRQFEPLVRRMVTRGDYLGPHSDKHLLYCAWEAGHHTLVTQNEFRTDLQTCLKKLKRLGRAPRYFLPPYEHYNREVAGWTHELGLTLINGTPGTRSPADYTPDAATNFVSSQAIYDSIVHRAQTGTDGLNGFMLLLHAGSGPQRADKFAARLDELLGFLAGQGYQFVRVDELLDPQARDLFIRASQVGYSRHDLKTAVAFAKTALPERFSVLEAASGRELFHGRSLLLSGQAWGQFAHHVRLDFSRFTKPGRYVLQMGGTRSLPFEIGDAIWSRLAEDGLEFMRQQRCGYNPWLGTNCHQLDGRTAYGPLPPGSPLDARGGWHDAGDLLKYQLTSGNATAQMLLAFQLAPRSTRFSDQVDGWGHPLTNGIPDLLDEARWGLEWLLKLHPAPDQLYHQVADDRDHIGFRLPQNETADYGWGKGGARVVYCADGRPQGLQQYQSDSTGLANLAGRYAAAMALAWQIWGNDPAQRAFAARCLQAGREVYELGRAGEGVQQGNSCRSPYRYEETTWADDMEWGAAELFRATGERRFLVEAKRYAQLAASESWMGRDQTKHYQFYPYCNLGHFRLGELVEPGYRQVLAGYYGEGIQRCVQAGQGNPYAAGVPFIWCSANLTVALATQCLLYERMTGDRRYRGFAAMQRDWLLGRNPWGHTLLTEIGSVFPTEVHLQTTKLTGRRVRGGLVDGPVYERIFRSLQGVSITEPDPLAEFQDSRAVYHNDFHDYATNEPIMDGTASAILLWALCAGR